MWTGHVFHQLNFEKLQDVIYDSKLNGSGDYLIQDIRAAAFRDKLTPIKVVSAFAVIKHALREGFELYDMYTDIYLGKQMYQYSRDDIETNNGRSIQDYNIVFVLVSLTVIAPVII